MKGTVMAVTMRPADESDDAQNAVKAKYVVPRSKDTRGNIMVDYVNLSANLLRKVRHGHSLGSVLAKSRSQRKSKSAIVDTELTDLAHEIAFKLPTSVRASRSTTQSRYAQSALANVALPRGAIRFGRKVRFRAADGGFLLIEDNGGMRKAPPEMQHDPRTCITLFPRDPITRVGPDKWVLSGDRLYIVQNASLHGAVQANSIQSYDVSAKRHVAFEDESRAGPYPRRKNQAKAVHCSHQSQELASSITWYLRQSKRSIQYDDYANGEYFYSGANVNIFQENRMLWCNLQFPVQNKRRYTAPSVTSFSSSTPMSTESAYEGSLASSSVPNMMNTTSISPVKGAAGSSSGSQFTRVWLDSEYATSLRSKGGSSEAHQTHWSNVWTIVCVDDTQTLKLNPKACNCANRQETDYVPVADLYSQNEAHEEFGNHHGGSSVVAREHRAALVIGRFFSRAARFGSSHQLQRPVNSRSLNNDAFVSRKRETIPDAKTKLTTPEQLMVLQHYNPGVYGSARSAASVNHRIPGVSLVGHVSIQREQRALARMRNEVALLSGDWQQPHWSPLPKNHPKPLERPRSAMAQTIVANREKELQFHVQMKMTRRGEPRLQFGSPSRLPKAVNSDKLMALSSRSIVSPLKALPS